MALRIPLLNNRTIYRKDGGDWIIMTPSGKILVTNGVGIAIIKLCTGVMSSTEIVGKVASLFGDKVTKSLSTEIENFLDELEFTRCIELLSSYSAPTVRLLGPSGLIEIKSTDQRIFVKGPGADPPCQL